MLIAIPLFDRFTALDAVGPFQVLVQLPGAKTIFLAERPRDVTDESGALTLRADASFADVPHPDIIVVPGGPGQADQMDGSPLRDWLIAADQTSTWTTSVCTGSLILAGAGLLDGRRATTNWLAMGELARLGAKPLQRALRLRRQVRHRGRRLGRHRHGAGAGRPDRRGRDGAAIPARHRVRPAAPVQRGLPGHRPGRDRGRPPRPQQVRARPRR